WIGTVAVPRSAKGEGRDIVYLVLEEPAALVWAANLAALELHVPMWKSRRQGEYGPADLMVFDLDPGAPADMVDCCRVGGWLRDALAEEGLEAHPKTSGSKGLQLYVRLEPARPWEEVRDRAHELARQIEKDHPKEVVSNMRRELRRGRVLIDWSQNHAAKTTVAPYSLRGRPHPTVSTPVAWDEVDDCVSSGEPERLVFESADVLQRVGDHGDLFGPLLPSRSAAGTAKRRSPAAPSSAGRSAKATRAKGTRPARSENG
ncbi:MAG TPA: DNA primase small subunit domain-containing protein, partial [Acidimicrobiales bacterium]|nr:DNA primase small subunit domain-containing protein [Acidimicrobiales bacterium]